MDAPSDLDRLLFSARLLRLRHAPLEIGAQLLPGDSGGRLDEGAHVEGDASPVVVDGLLGLPNQAGQLGAPTNGVTGSVECGLHPAKYRTARPPDQAWSREPKLSIRHEEPDRYAETMDKTAEELARVKAAMEAFGDRLKKARIVAKLTGDDLGEMVRVSKQLISHWEAGRYRPDLIQLQDLCRSLNISADSLVLGREGLSPEAYALADSWDKQPTHLRERFRQYWELVFPRNDVGQDDQGSDDHHSPPRQVASTGAPKRKEASPWTKQSEEESTVKR